MICLGIESTAHTFGIGIVRDEPFEILANAKRTYTTEEGGLVPVELSEHHLDTFRDVLDQALEQAGKSVEDIDLISYSRAPGLGHALRIGAALARALAIKHGIPIVGVNHCVAHLEIGRKLGGQEDPVLLYVSGANTQVIAEHTGRYRIFGETLDLGAGNFLDTVARMLELGFPGGPKIERLASTHEGPLTELPYVVKGMDVSFSGMQTKVQQLLEAGAQPAAICYAVQEHAFAMLVEVAERALAHTGKQALVLGGGVACNERLQEMCRQMCKARNTQFFCPEKQYLVDNGAMIALLGLKMHAQGMKLAPSKADIDPYERTEEFVINL